VFQAHPAARYTLAPLYAFCAWSLGEALAGGPRPALWAAGLAACTAAVLVPSPLVEFRRDMQCGCRDRGMSAPRGSAHLLLWLRLHHLIA
jgi:hypothetical protein